MADSVTLRGVQDPATCLAGFAVRRELRPLSMTPRHSPP